MCKGVLIVRNSFKPRIRIKKTWFWFYFSFTPATLKIQNKNLAFCILNSRVLWIVFYFQWSKVYILVINTSFTFLMLSSWIHRQKSINKLLVKHHCTAYYVYCLNVSLLFYFICFEFLHCHSIASVSRIFMLSTCITTPCSLIRSL